MTTRDAGEDDRISEEARLMAARVRARAEQMPTPEQIAGLGADAFSKQAEHMSPAEIRRLFAEVVAQSQQMAYLLGKLAGLEGTPDGEP